MRALKFSAWLAMMKTVYKVLLQSLHCVRVVHHALLRLCASLYPDTDSPTQDGDVIKVAREEPTREPLSSAVGEPEMKILADEGGFILDSREAEARDHSELDPAFSGAAALALLDGKSTQEKDRTAHPPRPLGKPRNRSVPLSGGERGMGIIDMCPFVFVGTISTPHR